MAEIPNFLEAGAFGILNDILAGYRDDNGYAQPNRFEVLIFPPSKLGGGTNLDVFAGLERRGGKNDLEKISLRAQDINLPGRNLATTQDTNIYGPSREVVEGVTYAEEISVQFQASSQLSERVFFENWQRSAFNEKTWNIGYYNDYIGSMEIYVLDRKDKRRYGIKLWEVFPKTIGANALSYGANDTIMLTPVNFSFRYWTSLDQTNNPKINIFGRVLETTLNVAERNISRNIPRILNRL
jgi:hypothetical protein|tara:strand:+ start:33 stop:752 length:720 start_codon:yes stop_codon:yes gene_type:complete